MNECLSQTVLISWYALLLLILSHLASTYTLSIMFIVVLIVVGQLELGRGGQREI